MSIPLNVLIIEDSEDDALLVVRELKQAAYKPAYERIETEKAMKDALAGQKWNIVISDYIMPRFSGLDALKLLQETGIDLPFIIVSGLIGEDTAVEAMKAGADDYIMKGNLSRLGPAVRRELREAKVRQDHRLAEETIKESENLYRTIFETTGTAMLIFEEDTTISLMNREVEKVFGYSKEELEGKKGWTEFVFKDELGRLKEYHRLRRINPGAVPKNYETKIIDKNGSVKDVFVTADIIPGTGKSIASITDITQRKRMENELKKKVKELEEFYDIAIGRELRMKELKEEIERLKGELEKDKKP